MSDLLNFENMTEEQLEDCYCNGMGDNVCCYGNLSINFIKKYINDFTESQWKYLLAHQKCIDDNFLRECGEYFNLWKVYCEQSGAEMTHSFIEEFKDKIDWEALTEAKIEWSKDYGFFRRFENYVDRNVIESYKESFKLEKQLRVPTWNRVIKDKKMIKTLNFLF